MQQLSNFFVYLYKQQRHIWHHLTGRKVQHTMKTLSLYHRTGQPCLHKGSSSEPFRSRHTCWRECIREYLVEHGYWNGGFCVERVDDLESCDVYVENTSTDGSHIYLKVDKTPLEERGLDRWLEGDTYHSSLGYIQPKKIDETGIVSRGVDKERSLNDVNYLSMTELETSDTYSVKKYGGWPCNDRSKPCNCS